MITLSTQSQKETAMSDFITQVNAKAERDAERVDEKKPSTLPLPDDVINIPVGGAVIDGPHNYKMDVQVIMTVEEHKYYMSSTDIDSNIHRKYNVSDQIAAGSGMTFDVQMDWAMIEKDFAEDRKNEFNAAAVVRDPFSDGMSQLNNSLPFKEFGRDDPNSGISGSNKTTLVPNAITLDSPQNATFAGDVTIKITESDN